MKKPPLFSFAKAVAANAEEVQSMGDPLPCTIIYPMSLATEGL
jgi:hypothetical protein